MRRHATGSLLLQATVLIALVWTPAAHGESTETADVMHGLERWLQGTHDLQGSFRQSLVSGAFGSGLEERGRLFIKRPGRMRWDYRDPERKVAIVDGDRVWLYVAGERELTLGHLEENGRLLPSLLAAGRPLSELFDAVLLKDGSSGGKGDYRLQLTPLDSTEEFERVVVELAPDFAVRSAEVQDAAGNRMLYTFSDLRRNRGLPDGLFHFDPPEGTVIVGEH